MRFTVALDSVRRGHLLDWSTVSVHGEDVCNILAHYQEYKYDKLIDRIISDTTITPLTTDNTDLAYVMANETVRPVRDIDKVRERMSGGGGGGGGSAGRGMYGLIHEGMPKRPIIFCSLVLQRTESLVGFMSRVNDVHGCDDQCDTAVFYSVNSPWNIGRAGWFLKSVMQIHLASVENVITFSPIPLLRKPNQTGILDREAVRAHLTRECPVFKFHTQNGAKLHDILENADTTTLGISNSYGWQASYKYR